MDYPATKASTEKQYFNERERGVLIEYLLFSHNIFFIVRLAIRSLDIILTNISRLNCPFERCDLWIILRLKHQPQKNILMGEKQM